MKIKPLFFGGACALLIASSTFASSQPPISTSSGAAVQISSARLVNAPGGSYVTGTVKTSFGYSAPLAVHVHVTAYDAGGHLLGESIDKINATRLVRSHYNPSPRASYVAFLPWKPSQVARVTVVEHSGRSHPASSFLSEK